MTCVAMVSSRDSGSNSNSTIITLQNIVHEKQLYRISQKDSITHIFTYITMYCIHFGIMYF